MKTFIDWLFEDANFLSKIKGYALGTDKCNSDKQYAIIPKENNRYEVIQLFRGNRTGTVETTADGVKKNFLPVIDPNSWKDKELIKELL